jgi:hypothetical protein
VAEIRYQTSSAICTVLMAAACFPEEQAEVQAELDAIIGKHRGNTIRLHNSIDGIASPIKHQPSLTSHLFLACKPSSLRL